MKTVTLTEQQINNICALLAKANHPNASWEIVNNVIGELQKELNQAKEPSKKDS